MSKLKKIIPTTEGLHEAIAALYEKRDDGKFHLLVEDDAGDELRRAKDHEVGLRQIAERDLAAAKLELTTSQTTVAQLQQDAGVDKNKLREQLAAEYATKEEKLIKDHTAEKEALEKTVKKVFVNDVALRIATEITDIPDVLVPLIEKRLQVEIVNGEPVTRVLKDDGSASTMTPDQLRDEYSQNKKFERIIRGSNASGGGANGGHGGGGAPKKLSEMGDAERTEWATRDPDGFQRAVDADRLASGKT